jgi:hypothetical protein
MVPESERNWVAVNAVSTIQPQQKKQNMTTLHLKKSMARSPLRLAFVLILLLLVCFGISPTAKAVSPAPDGDYPNGNTAEGFGALLNLANGSRNTATGLYALRDNLDGEDNTATGGFALVDNINGSRNTATGAFALYRNVGRNDNTAVGFHALYFSNGDGNTAIGSHALANNIGGKGNIALGNEAGRHLANGSSNIDIGNEGVAGEGSTIRIGSASQTKTFIAGVSGTGVTGAAVQVNAAGQLGTAPSSARFKDEIRPMDKASEAILALQPVTFRYKKEIDPAGTQQFGLVAEEVEKVSSDLVVHGEKGKPYSVRYDQVNAMLLNEFLKEHKAFVEEHSSVEKLQVTVAQQQKQIEMLTAGLQKVSAQLELNKHAPQVVNNP